YDRLQGKLRTEKINDLLASLKKQQLKAAEIVCPEKRQAFANISLTRNTVTDRIADLSADLDSQKKHKVKSFVAFSVAIDESTDITDVAQLAIFIRGVDEFLELVPMTDTTTANDIFSAVVEALDRVGVDWTRDVSVATDGAPSMIGRKTGVVTKFKEKVQAANGGQRFWTFLSDKDINFGLPYHAEVRWLSRGAMLKRFFDLREKIGQFMEKKGKPVHELKNPEWLQHLAYMVDITEHLNNLNKMLQGRKKVVTQYYDNIRAFKLKLTLWETQLSSGAAAHFPHLRNVQMTGITADMSRYKDKITELLREFEQRFQVFGELETEFAIFRSPFTVKAADLPINIQLEIIDLQCDQDLKDKFASSDLDTFYRYILPGYPKLIALAAKVLSIFGTTYLCEQVFSVMNITKTKLRSRLTRKYLNDVLKLAA
uniref:DUF4371 domain-containing protein n=1 Tax=Gasterosteus aculeatus TaxID=69293 RepID=G3N7N2_GASAC